MVTINLHDKLGRMVGKSQFKLAVSSVSEAIHAINVLTGGKLYKVLKELGHDKFELKINNHLFKKNRNWEEKLDSEALNEIRDSELCFKNKKLERIDIVPIIQAAEDALAIILGALLIIIGIILIATPFGAPLILGGIGLVAAGVINLLATPPQFDDFREIEQGGRRSYLFNGPQNTIREGGPVPVGYGRLIVGSQTISASYDISNIAVSESDSKNIPPEGNVAAFNIGGASVGYFTSAKLKNTKIYKNSSSKSWIKIFDNGSNPIFNDYEGVAYQNDYELSGPKEIYQSLVMSANNSAPLKIQVGVGEFNDIPSGEITGAIFEYRLHFAEPFYNAGTRIFTISANGQLLEVNGSTSFDIASASLANGSKKSYVLTGTTSPSGTDENGIGYIEFLFTSITSPPGNFAFINAIEIYRSV